MKTFLALAVLSLATSVTTQAALSSPDSAIHQPKISQVVTGESDITSALPRPKPRLIGENVDTRRQPPRVVTGSVEGSDLSLRQRPRFTAVEVTAPNRTPTRPKLREGSNIRKPHFSGSELIAAQSRPKPPGAAV